MLNGWLFDWPNCAWSIDRWIVRSIDWLIDWFSGWQDGVVQPDTLVALYPGTVYDAGEPVLLQSLGNPYIIQCVDGCYIDGKSRGISRLIYKYIPLHHRLVESCKHISLRIDFWRISTLWYVLLRFVLDPVLIVIFFTAIDGATSVGWRRGEWPIRTRLVSMWTMPDHQVFRITVSFFEANNLLLLYHSTKFPICLSYLQTFNLMSHTTNSRYRPSLTWSTGSTSRTSTFPQKKTSKSIPKKCRYLFKLPFVSCGFKSMESFRLFFLFRFQAASNDWSNQSACYSG